jgi:hypothetical protein
VIADLLKVGTNISFIKQDFTRDGAAMSWTELNRALPITVARQSNGDWGSISNGGQTVPNVAGNNQLRKLAEGEAPGIKIIICKLQLMQA